MAHDLAVSGWRWFWSPTGHWYQFWSGFGSCLTEFAILGAVWRHLNCHSQGCWRLARHPVDGTPYKTCRRHHPTVPTRGANLSDIHEAHRQSQAR